MFVRTTNDTTAKAFAQPCEALVTPLLDDALASLGILSEQHFFPTGRLLLPIRLHLANQVLLI